MGKIATSAPSHTYTYTYTHTHILIPRSPHHQVYAVVVGALSAVTSLLYLLPFILRFAAVTAWSLVLFVLWIALFGVFGRLYIREDPEGNADIRRMKSAVWVDLASALLWLFGTLASAAYWWTHRERHSRFTGRARLDRNASVRSRSSAWRA